MDYQPHELSRAFPDMSADQFDRLCSDIKANGLLHPVVLFEGQILDGRHRYLACRKVGVSPRFEDYAGSDPVAYVTSENAARRHLTPSQIAHAVAAMAGWEREQARKRRAHGETAPGKRLAPTDAKRSDDGESGRVREVLASKAGVGVKTVERAIKVRERGTDALNAKVAAGAITVNEAEKIAEFRPDIQNRIVAIEDKRQRQIEVQKTAAKVNASTVARANERKPRDDMAIKPRFTARFFGRLRTMQAGIREDLGADAATKDIVNAVMAGLSEEDDLSIQQVIPILDACVDIRRQLAANGQAAAA